MRYEWDERKNEANIAKHGIDFADAHRIFLTPHFSGPAFFWPRIFLAPLLIALDDRSDYGEDR